ASLARVAAARRGRSLYRAGLRRGGRLRLVRRASQALRLGAALLLLEPAVAGRLGRLPRNAFPLPAERFAQRSDQPPDPELAVAGLAPLVLCHGSQHGPGA